MLKKDLNLLWILIVVILVSCKQNNPEDLVSESRFKDLLDVTQYVNPFVGTKNMGHTFNMQILPFLVLVIPISVERDILT